jgi:hypothetical protein
MGDQASAGSHFCCIPHKVAPAHNHQLLLLLSASASRLLGVWRLLVAKLRVMLGGTAGSARPDPLLMAASCMSPCWLVVPR